MALNLTQKMVTFLQKNAGQKFKARDIARWVFETYPEDCRAKQKRSTAKVTPLDSDAALIQQLVAEIGSQWPQIQKRFPAIKATAGRPRFYYYTACSDAEEVEQAENPSPSVSSAQSADSLPEAKTHSEHDLYPILSDYVRIELGVHSTRIDEKTSSNTRGPNGNKWLHPDVVGIEDLTAEWQPEVKNLVRLHTTPKSRLWSFEVKILLNSSNVREAFFQAVSNSSWANFGYLVACDINTDAMEELRILSPLHGIGVIQLVPKDLADSQIMLPARERTDVDWATCNRLTEENSDFGQFMTLVRQFYQTGDLRPQDWDASVSLLETPQSKPKPKAQKTRTRKSALQPT